MSCLVWRRSSDYSEDELISKLFANENIEKIGKFVMEAKRSRHKISTFFLF